MAIQKLTIRIYCGCGNSHSPMTMTIYSNAIQARTLVLSRLDQELSNYNQDRACDNPLGVIRDEGGNILADHR
jgi:hypothetical protein